MTLDLFDVHGALSTSIGSVENAMRRCFVYRLFGCNSFACRNTNGQLTSTLNFTAIYMVLFLLSTLSLSSLVFCTFSLALIQEVTIVSFQMMNWTNLRKAKEPPLMVSQKGVVVWPRQLFVGP